MIKISKIEDIYDSKIYRYKQIMSSSKFSSMQKKIVKRLTDVGLNSKYSEYEQVILCEVNDAYIVGWGAIDSLDRMVDMTLLYSEQSDSFVTLDDIEAAVDDDSISIEDLSRRFKKLCTSRKWSIVYYKEKKQNDKASIIGKKLGINMNAVEGYWRKGVYGHQELADEEKKAILDACHKMIDLFVEDGKDFDRLGLLVFS